MVKCSIYQCTDCKTVFNARWYISGYDGPFVIERYYDEHNADRQFCPECKSRYLTYLGKTKITRREMKQLVDNYPDGKDFFWFLIPKKCSEPKQSNLLWWRKTNVIR